MDDNESPVRAFFVRLSGEGENLTSGGRAGNQSTCGENGERIHFCGLWVYNTTACRGFPTLALRKPSKRVATVV